MEISGNSGSNKDRLFKILFKHELTSEFHGVLTTEFHGVLTTEFHGVLTTEFHGVFSHGVTRSINGGTLSEDQITLCNSVSTPCNSVVKNLCKSVVKKVNAG